jgi:hypothetical protein
MNGERIVLWGEQGLGDTIQFARYASLVQKKGGRVILSVPENLVDLMAWASDPFEMLTSRTVEPFQLQAPLMSLPLLMKTSDEQSIPSPLTFQLPSAIRDKWEMSFGQKSGLRVALVWAGSPTHINDYNRSIPLKMLSPLLFVAGVRFYSLQIGPSSSAISTEGWAEHIVNLAPFIKDLRDTAGILSQIDLLITVDTAVAHLAGSLGTPAWVLLPFAPDWRWLLDRSDSPWYPSMRLFRQPAPRDWAHVVADVASELRGLTTTRPVPD